MSTEIFTNEIIFGSKFKNQLKNDLKASNGLIIASGYFGAALISEFESKLVKIGLKGTCKILLGMVYFGGVSKKQLDSLTSLDNKLRKYNPENGVFITKKEYHGKIYKFSRTDGDYKIYIGSSNFSPNGFDFRRECNIEVDSIEKKENINYYLDFLFNDKDTHNLKDVELSRKARKKLLNLSNLENCLIDSSEYPHNEKIIGTCEIKIRADQQPISSLNLFFGKGRKDLNDKYQPRPWYEVELSATKKEIHQDFYPASKRISDDTYSRTGDFIGYTKDNGKLYRIEMRVHGDYGKNISSSRSSGGRSTLGQLIKGKLERENFNLPLKT